jgi:inhibitor of cysteine peptidase
MLNQILHQPNKFIVSLALMLVFTLSACSPLATLPVHAGEPVINAPSEEPADLEDVLIESLEILMLESFPVQVQVIVRGQLPDACSYIEMVEQGYGGSHFTVTLFNARHPNMRCAPQPTPFEENILLDVLGLDAGVYTVNIHGVEETFELPVDNFLPEE